MVGAFEAGQAHQQNLDSAADRHLADVQAQQEQLREHIDERIQAVYMSPAAISQRHNVTHQIAEDVASRLVGQALSPQDEPILVSAANSSFKQPGQNFMSRPTAKPAPQPPMPPISHSGPRCATCGLEHRLCKINGPRSDADDCYLRAPALPGSANIIQLDFMTLSTLDDQKADEIIREAHAHGCLRGFANAYVEAYRIKMRNHILGMQQKFHAGPSSVDGSPIAGSH
jgi:hypothetical protein